MRTASQSIDRTDVVFDEPGLVANAGLVMVATLVARLGLERLVDETVRLVGRVGGAHAGRKVLTLVHTLVASGSHIDHAEMLRAGHPAGAPVSGGGPLSVGDVSAVLHVRACPPVGPGDRRDPPAGVGAGCRPW